MPALILWAVPTLIVVGGVDYYLVRLQDKKKARVAMPAGLFLVFLFQQGLEYPGEDTAQCSLGPRPHHSARLRS
jgi:hypothetical protein